MMRLMNNSEAICEQSTRVVNSVRKKFPMRVAVSWAGKSTDKQRESAMRQIAAEVRAFARSQRLSWLGKARLSNKLKWELRSLGYSESFVNDFLLALWVHSEN